MPLVMPMVPGDCSEVLIQGKHPCHLSTGKQLRAFQVALVLKYLLPMQEMQEMWV